MAERYDRDDGYEFVICDYSQIELRMLAHCTQDDAMIKTFVDDGDPHQLTADKAGVERVVTSTLRWCMAQVHGLSLIPSRKLIARSQRKGMYGSGLMT